MRAIRVKVLRKADQLREGVCGAAHLTLMLETLQ